jgi:hypothetical protein
MGASSDEAISRFEASGSEEQVFVCRYSGDTIACRRRTSPAGWTLESPRAGLGCLTAPVYDSHGCSLVREVLPRHNRRAHLQGRVPDAPAWRDPGVMETWAAEHKPAMEDVLDPLGWKDFERQGRRDVGGRSRSPFWL